MAQNTILLADLSDEVLNAMGGAGPWQSITTPATGVGVDTEIDEVASDNSFNILGATWILDVVSASGSTESCQLTVRCKVREGDAVGGYEPTILSDGFNDPYDAGEIDIEVNWNGDGDGKFLLNLIVNSGTWSVTGRRTYQISQIAPI